MEGTVDNKARNPAINPGRRESLTEYAVVYVTTSNLEEARKIAEAVVEERLAACANIYPEIRSIYWWQGKVEESGETALILKTRRELVPKVVERVKQLHSYTVPCIITLPIAEGNREFLEWIRGETKTENQA